MNQPRDDEYGSLRDLFGGDPEDERPAEPAVPEGLSPELAEAYRRGYERASRGEESTVQLDREGATALAYRDDAPDGLRSRESDDDRPTEQIAVHRGPAVPGEGGSGAAADPSYDADPVADEDFRRRRLVAVGLGGLALVLVVTAFGIGRMFADNVAEGESETGPKASAGAASSAEPYSGPVRAVTVSQGTATCQSGSSVDAAGNPMSYEPARALDSNLSTAWRCDGSGVGQRLTVSLPEWTSVAQVGLVPGYAKTDPASGVDRYAENNRITKVRWTFDDGTTFVQKMSGDPSNRRMRTMRVPETSTSSLVIEILASKPGPRNTVAISEIRVARPAG